MSEIGIPTSGYRMATDAENEEARRQLREASAAAQAAYAASRAATRTLTEAAEVERIRRHGK